MLDPCARQDPVSATQLEGAAGCAFRHFLSRGLGLHAVDDGQREMDVWLAPMLRGSLLHDLYAQLMRRGRDAKRRVSKKADLQWFLERGRLALEGLRVEMPPPSDEVFEREQQELLGDLELFIGGEEDGEASRTPLGFEVSFGRPDDGVEPLATAAPIEISLGKGLTFRLAGRIDRIDQIGPDSFEIVDYKTGGYFEKDYEGVFGGGTKLQHALYGLAAVAILKGRVKGAKVARGVYYFSSSRGRLERRVIEQPSLGTITEVLSDLREVIASGLFVHAPQVGACRFCDYGAACGGDPSVARSAAKRAVDARLAPNGKLAAHE
jgi:ATP-dependent helicase/nuclease subunit B